MANESEELSYILTMYLCVSVLEYGHVSVSTLELQAVVSQSLWLLKTELQPSRRAAARALNR